MILIWIFLVTKDFFFFWPHYAAFGILVPRSGIEPGSWQWKHRALTTGQPGNSLMTHDIKHFSCAYFPPVLCILLIYMSLYVFAHILIEWFFFKLLSFDIFLILVICQICGLQIFSPTLELIFLSSLHHLLQRKGF